VLAGKPQIEIPADPAIRCLGTVSDQEKSALIAACDLLLLRVPSRASRSACSRPGRWVGPSSSTPSAAFSRTVPPEQRRAVLPGYAEFAPALRRLLGDPALRTALGRSGRAYVQAEYGWDVVESRTNAFLTSLAARPRFSTRRPRPGPGGCNPPHARWRMLRRRRPLHVPRHRRGRGVHPLQPMSRWST